MTEMPKWLLPTAPRALWKAPPDLPCRSVRDDSCAKDVKPGICGRGSSRPIEIDGVSYRSVRHAAIELKVHRRVIYQLLGEGWRAP
jgi:hypothetical protein